MLYVSFFVVFLSFFQSFQVTHEIIISDSTISKYVAELIKEFRENPTSSRFDSVIIPPRIGVNKQAFLLPKVFIWCPMSHFELEIVCPIHEIPLKAGFFTDELQKTSPRNPRLAYDLRGNILLIQRFYICKNGTTCHKFLSASMEVLKTIPKLYGLACFPIMMFHRSACTKQLVDFIETQVIQGVNFLQICNGIAALNFKEYCERMECHSLSENSCGLKNQSQYDSFYCNDFFSFPSNDKIMNIFLADFNTKHPMYIQKMNELARDSKFLMCDHTFRISKYIGASRACDKKFIKQFENLYIMMNENRHIVGWRLTKTTAFEEIKDLLEDFKSKLKEDLDVVIVDDCCKVRNSYQSIFPSVKVKLDLFHAVQRIVKTFPKGTETSKQISNEFGLIFREDGDCGDIRKLPTPAPETIDRNLNNFMSRWKKILECDSQGKTLHELQNLRIHILKGCISGLSPGQGTECNERLHHTLNESLLCGASTISPEIAIAVLSLLFYGLNCKKTGKKHQNNARVVPFMPLPKHTLHTETNDKESFFHKHDGELILENVWDVCAVKSNCNSSHKNAEIVVIQSIKDMLNDTITGLICDNAVQLFETLGKVRDQCNDRSFNVMDIPIMQLVGVRKMLQTDDGVANDQDQVITRNLKAFNLAIDPVIGDGDCAFSSIIKQLRKTNAWLDENNGNLRKHIRDLGLDGDLEDAVFCLRQIFVDNVQSSEEYQVLLGIDQLELNYETERFRDEGTFCGEMGDLIMKVCSDILQVPIIVITSMPGCPYVPFIPEQQATTETLYVSFNSSGPGHYDATRLVNGEGK